MTKRCDRRDKVDEVIACGLDATYHPGTMCLVCKKRDVPVYDLKIGTVVIGLCMDCLAEVSIVITSYLTHIIGSMTDQIDDMVSSGRRMEE